MPIKNISRLRMIVLPALIICLSGVLITTWRGKSEARLTPKSQRQTGRGMSAMIHNLKNDGIQFPAFKISSSQTELDKVVSEDILDRGKAFNLDHNAISTLLAGNNQTLTLKVPDPTETSAEMELELTRVNLVAEGFRVRTSSSDGNTIEVPLGVHYRGTVKGVPGSLAAISVFEDEVAGLYSLPNEGNMVLGKVRGNSNNMHITFPASELRKENPFLCKTKDDEVSISQSELVDQTTEVPGGCVKIYVEADYDLFQNKGSVANTVNYVEAFFNQSATIYANDGIPISLSEVFVWDTKSPYKGTSSSRLLQQFQRYRNSFNGDLGHLVALRGGGGIAAGFNGFCNSNTDQRQCFSGINPTYSNVPTYSWTVEVFTHEMGHLMGSRHTHACVWNGNNTAIDGCYNPEGTCARPEIPAGGGTIMSYCHLTSVGINFTNGFGPQPGALIRNRVSAASCITACN